jgi:hypothetical protein
MLPGQAAEVRTCITSAVHFANQEQSRTICAGRTPMLARSLPARIRRSAHASLPRATLQP